MSEFIFFTGLIIAGPVAVLAGVAAIHALKWTLGSLGRIGKGLIGF